MDVDGTEAFVEQDDSGAIDVKLNPNNKAKQTILGDGFSRSENVSALGAYITAAAGEIFTVHTLTQVLRCPILTKNGGMQRVQT
jgi:hypothetical protein